MDKDYFRERLADLMAKGILERGLMVLDDFWNPVRQLLEQRRVPAEGWSDKQVKFFLELLSQMDTDKDSKAARVGEREGRVVSELGLDLAAGFAHGIGRSGNIGAVQPKAAGGSVLNLLAARLATSLLKEVGLPAVRSSIVLPVATGMSLALCFASIHARHVEADPASPWKKPDIVATRVDHKSPLKGITLAGFTARITRSVLDGDKVVVPVDAVHEMITPGTAAVMSTTAFFPPRAPDDVKGIAKLCEDLDIPHVVNNSYGVQSEQYLKLLRGAMDAGRVDLIVQSTDKNFLTPVGGAVICSNNEDRISEVSQCYAGRASAQPLVQFIASVLAMGTSGYKDLMASQVRQRAYLEDRVGELAAKAGQRLLEIGNPIAVAMTLEGLEKNIGGDLYNLRVTGPRVLFPGDFGSCIDTYPRPYITLNAGIGARDEDFEHLANKLGVLLGT